MKLSKLLPLILISLPLTTLAFSDVPADHPNYQAIQYLQTKGTIEGYEDDTFKPDRLINRAEFLKIVLKSQAAPETSIEPEAPCFPDVPTDEWYAPYICQAYSQQIIKGYPDGTFKPSKNITFVEAAKIILESQPSNKKTPSSVAVIAADTNSTTPSTGEGIQSGNPDPIPWYQSYISDLDKSQAIPDTIKYLNEPITRGQMSEIIWRLAEKPQNISHTPADQLTLKPDCQPLGEDLPSNIDPNRIRQTWLEWMNAERATLGRAPYTYNPQLDRTATNWSNYSRDRGYINHKRPGTTAYYDYNAITSWYRDLGLEFANVNRVTHSENIGWDVYNCSEEDCTDYAISKLKNVFNFYMKEKGRASAPHYDSMTNAYFNEIGLGIAIGGGKIYFTTHYGTEITSSPKPVCTP